MSFIENTQTTRNEEEQACLFAMKLATAHTLPMVLKSAVELELLEIIAKAGEGQFLSAKEIASQIPSKNVDAPLILDRILRLLASYSVLKCELRETGEMVERFYGATPVVKYLTRNEDGDTLAAFLLLGQDKNVRESWYYLKDAVLEGGTPFNKAYGNNRYEYYETDQTYTTKFNNGMSNHSTFTMKRILETYTGFEGLRSVVDVGGGVGATLNMIISKYPSVKGINFDLPHVIKEAPTFPGLEHVGGDMFVSVPKGDAIFMKFIFHNWSDENCLKILKNCYDALPQNGKVIIAEYVTPEYPDTSLETKNIFDMDIHMFKNFPGAKERTEKEFETMAKSAGFLGFLVMCTSNCISVMEFLKNI